MTLEDRLAALITAIGADVKAVSGRKIQQVFSISGPVPVMTGAQRWYNDTGRTLTITSVRATVGSAPSGAAIIVDVNTNGSSIFTSTAHKPTIADGGTTSGKDTSIDVATVNDGDYLTVDVDQIGSTNPGSDLTLVVVMV